MEFAAFSHSSKSKLTRSFVLLCLLATAACRGKFEASIPTVIQGKEFTHRIAFPSAFYESKSPQDGLFGPASFNVVRNDQQCFRISPSSPDVLLVAACDIDRERFSENSFAVNTANGYSVRPTSWNDWNSGIEIPDVTALAQAGGRTRNVKDVANSYEYQGHSYPVRGDLHEGKWMVATHDGTLVVVAGGTPPSDSNKYMLDVFDGRTGQRLVAVDVAYKWGSLQYALLDAHLINSRWVTITLQSDFSQMLLIDLKAAK